MRTIFGYLAIFLGLLGVLVALGSAVAVWPGGAAVSARTDEFTTNATGRLEELDPMLNRLEQKASETAAAVERLSVVASRVADGTTKDDPQQEMKLLELLQTLTPLMNQAKVLAESLKSIGMLMKSSAELGSKFGQSNTKSEQLRSIADMMLLSAETLAGIQAEFDAAQAGKAVPRAEKIADLATRAGAPLKRVALGLSDVQRQSSNLKEGLAELRSEVHFWSIAGPALLDLLLLWFGLGQLCLIGWGRSKVATRTLAPEGRSWSAS